MNIETELSTHSIGHSIEIDLINAVVYLHRR